MALIDSLISYWKLDEATGNALDAHGSDPLTENGTVPAQTGQINGARGAYATANTFNNTNVLSIDSATSHSVSLWINILSFGTRGVLNVGGDGDANVFESRFTLTPGNTFQVRTVESGVAVRLTVAAALSTGWRHIVFTYDGSTRDAILYIDGSSAATATGSSGGNAGTKFFIGHSADSGTELTTGYMDETGLWNKVLSPSEVTELWNSGSGLAYPFSAGGTNAQINIGDSWKEISAMQINIGDTWKPVAGAQINIGDAWKTIF